MNPRIAAFDFITRSLSVDSNSETLRFYISSGKLNWGLVVGMANQHLVTPALWAGLRNKGLAETLPKDLKEYLETFHSFNRDRNLQLKKMTMEVVAKLNGQNIEPVLLKGAAHLFINTFDDMGARMMGDVDILVPKDVFENCLAVFSSLHFRSDDVLKEKLAEHHHHAPLFRPGDYAAIELHRDIMFSAVSHILPTETGWAHTRPIEVDGLRMRVLSPTHRVLHNILHSEVVDRNHQEGVICLRQIHDLVTICAKYGPEIDWRTIRECMNRHGEGKVLQSYLYMAHRLFGMVLSPQIRPAFGGVGHYMRCRLKIRFARWDHFLQRFSARRICRDYGCGRTFLPLTIARMRYAFFLLKKYTGRTS